VENIATLDVIDSPSLPKLAPNEYRPGLTKRQSKFVDCYIQFGDKIKAAIAAGYSVKSAPNEACRLLKHATILQYLEDWRKTKKKELTKDDFVDLAMGDYRALEVTEANKPRFLELAGKTLGYVGTAGVINVDRSQTLVINADLKDKSAGDLWAMARKLIEQSDNV
jgi:hypothetical protein